MRRTIVSALVGFGMAFAVFWGVDVIERLNRAAEVAVMQAQSASDWLELTNVTVQNGHSRPGVMFEPAVTWTIHPKRLLEARVAVTSRDLQSGEPVCAGGTVTFLLGPSEPQTTTRALSRIAGVERCDWKVGQYASRFVWSLTDPESRVSKSIVLESGPFEVVP